MPQHTMPPYTPNTPSSPPRTHRLAERQTPTGGLNGRPEKLPDVCYSWWCLSALAILHRLHWIDQPALTNFILNCQVWWCGVVYWCGVV